MPAGDGETLAAQVFGKFMFHHHSGIKGHWVIDFEQFPQEPDSMLLDHSGRLLPVLVIGKALVRGQAGHSYVDARFVWVTTRISFAKVR